MEWKDIIVSGKVELSSVQVGAIRVEIARDGKKWYLLTNRLAKGKYLAATYLAQAKTEAAAIVRVALEEALAALVGEDMALSHSACPHVNAFRKHCAKRK